MNTGPRRSNNRLTPTQARAARRTRRRNRRRFLKIGSFSAVGLVAMAFIVSLFLPSVAGLGFGGLFGTDAPDGPGERIAEMNRTHINPGDVHDPYNSLPPTSGWHYVQPIAPVRWGIHDEVLPDEITLHNLEHGGIAIHYNCPDACADLVTKLSDIVNTATANGLKVIMSPYSEMPNRIALTAWTFIEAFEEFDEKRIKSFITAHESSPNSPEPNAR